MRFAGLSVRGRLATQLACLFVPKYMGRIQLSKLNDMGYISPNSTIQHDKLSRGKNIFIGDHVIIFKAGDGGPVVLDNGVFILGETFIHTGQGGKIKIGQNTHIQPCCHLLAYKGSIEIGKNVQIAPRCAFYPYDHGFLPGEPIYKQALTSKGDIKIGNDAWIGFGVIVLSGVTIGDGAVVGAGSIVTRSIPENSVAVGSPARVIRMRSEFGGAYPD
jgi:acetyltransferase-like isoleucine patch superfamily enzyme